MIVYYLEPSAWVKRYLDEPGSAAVNALVRRPVPLTCSTLGPIEVMSAIARKERQGVASVTAAAAAARVRADFERFTPIGFADEVFDVALELPLIHPLRGADAVHLASAIVARRALEDSDDSLTLVSSDLELLRAAEAARFTVIDPAAP